MAESTKRTEDLRSRNEHATTVWAWLIPDPLMSLLMIVTESRSSERRAGVVPVLITLSVVTAGAMAGVLLAMSGLMG